MKDIIAAIIKKMDLTQILLLIAIGFIVYFVVFDEDPNPNARLEFEQEILEKELDSMARELKLAKDSIVIFENINKDWENKDSLNSLEMDKIRKENNAISNKLSNATKERRKAEKMLKEFRENGYKIDDPAELLRDTKKRIEDND